MSGGDPVIPTPIGLLSLSHVHPHVPDCCHVVDLILDPPGRRTCQGHAGSDIIAHAAHTARQFTESFTTRLIHQGIGSSNTIIYRPIIYFVILCCCGYIRAEFKMLSLASVVERILLICAVHV